MNHNSISPFDVVGDDHNTLFHNACVVGSTTIVELLKNGADVLKPDCHRDSPIHIACKYYNLDTFKILVSSSCDPNQQNESAMSTGVLTLSRIYFTASEPH